MLVNKRLICWNRLVENSSGSSRLCDCITLVAGFPTAVAMTAGFTMITMMAAAFMMAGMMMMMRIMTALARRMMDVFRTPALISRRAHTFKPTVPI